MELNGTYFWGATQRIALLGTTYNCLPMQMQAPWAGASQMLCTASKYVNPSSAGKDRQPSSRQTKQASTFPNPILKLEPLDSGRQEGNRAVQAKLWNATCQAELMAKWKEEKRASAVVPVLSSPKLQQLKLMSVYGLFQIPNSLYCLSAQEILFILHATDSSRHFLVICLSCTGEAILLGQA